MSTKVFLAHDEKMTLHQPLPGFSSSSDEGSSVTPASDVDTSAKNEPETEFIDEPPPMENPNRIRAIYKKLIQMEATDGGCGQRRRERRFIDVPCIPAKRETIELAHTSEHYDRMLQTRDMSDEELQTKSVPNDLYFCKDTFQAATIACGGVIECVNAVTDDSSIRKSNRAMAIVRPPGHHAEADEAMGFCYFNNVAVAAKHAVHSGRARRVFILDWDIHHGNGIQNLTYDDPQIFYMSIHRASFSRSRAENWFYPGTGRPTEVGNGDGEGTNLNIVWGEGGMGDQEYSAAFSQIVLPLLHNFKPDLIVVACGLDAVQGDLLGDCGLSPEMYYIMTRSLLEAATKIPIVAALEGGYNIEQSATCMEYVALAMLDEPIDYCHHLEHNQEAVVSSCRNTLSPQEEKSAQVVTRATSSKNWEMCGDGQKECSESTRNRHHEKNTSMTSCHQANKAAQNAIKRSAAAFQRKNGIGSSCLPMKKRKLIEV